MVNIEAVRASNATLKNLKPGLVGVFGMLNHEITIGRLIYAIVGGTSGIGESTLRAFVKHTVSPRVYIVGRSEEAANKIKEDVQKLNDQANIHFIKTDASLLRNVDSACKDIQAKENKVNILVLSSGYLTLKGREGEWSKFSLFIYLHPL